jgi:hypothetical protein
MLGQRLFRSMLEGLVSKAGVRALFHMNFSDLDQAFTTYLDLVSTPPAGGDCLGSPSRPSARAASDHSRNLQKNSRTV